MSNERKFGVIIISHGRAGRVHTLNTLKKEGYTGDYIILIDDEDESGDNYKKIYGEDGSVVLSVVKKVDDPNTQVDCVTGATLTSNGVDAMIKEGLKNVQGYAIGQLIESIASSDSTVVEPNVEEE